MGMSETKSQEHVRKAQPIEEKRRRQHNMVVFFFPFFFFLNCEDFWGMLDQSFPTALFFFSKWRLARAH